MTNFSLDDIRAAAEAKYGDTTITTSKGEVVMLNPLRLAKEKRKAFLSMQEELDKDGADQEELLHECLRLVTKTKKMADDLLKEIGSDLPTLAEIFNTYSKGTQAGEALASDD